jgi:Ankyrin repeats (3 copies)
VIVSLLVQYGALDAHVRPADDLSRQFLAAIFLADTARVGSLLGRYPRLATTADGRGDQPIHHAARNGDTEVVRLLIRHGADLNARGKRGQTVLYCAGGHGHLDTVRLLLGEGTGWDAIDELMEWLAQYPDDTRFAPITEALRLHKAGA